ncbi:Pvc16 family protein [Streptomyces sp. NPDC056463]|uniref:Pvc16 family protein n=1 Tax=unclassified Streptomyces TaxID=2593676 RepID=UPI0036905623
MSNTLAVPAVTAALTTLVQNAVNGLGINPGPVVAPGPLDSTGDQARVGVHLYRVTRNATLSLADLPTRSSAGQLRQKPRAALDLHYLFTFRGTDEWQTQALLARTAAALHTVPYLTDTLLAEAGTDHPEIDGNDLAQADEPVRVTPEALSTDELTRLWALFPPASFTVTLAVTAGPVLVDGDGDPGAVLPVRTVLAGAAPFTPPRLDGAAGPEGRGAPVRAAAPMPDLHLHGHALSAREGETSEVLVDGAVVSTGVTAVDDTHLVLPSPVLAPGRRRIAVRRSGPAAHPTLSTTRPAQTSPPVVILVVPTLRTVTAATSTGHQPGLRTGTVSAGVVPPVGQGNRVRLLLDATTPGSTVSLALAAELPAGTPPTAQVDFAVTDAPAGPYRVTLEVDGARSIPGLDSHGLYVLPVVTL